MLIAPKWLKLETSNLTRMFPGTVRTFGKENGMVKKRGGRKLEKEIWEGKGKKRRSG